MADTTENQELKELEDLMKVKNIYGWDDDDPAFIKRRPAWNSPSSVASPWAQTRLRPHHRRCGEPPSPTSTVGLSQLITETPLPPSPPTEPLSWGAHSRWEGRGVRAATPFPPTRPRSTSPPHRPHLRVRSDATGPTERPVPPHRHPTDPTGEHVPSHLPPPSAGSALPRWGRWEPVGPHRSTSPPF